MNSSQTSSTPCNFLSWVMTKKNIGMQSVRELFFVIGAFVKLFAEMIWLNVQYDLHTMLHR